MYNFKSKHISLHIYTKDKKTPTKQLLKEGRFVHGEEGEGGEQTGCAANI